MENDRQQPVEPWQTVPNPRREVFDRLGAIWDDLPKPPDLETILRHVADSGQIPAGGRVLDVGTGTGGLLPYLLSAGAAEVVAVDLSMEMLFRARKRVGAQALPICADAEYLPFSPAAFTTIFCHGVYPHFNHPELVLQNLQQALRPGGRLVISLAGGREKINAIHAGHASPVLHQDRMPPAEALTAQLTAAGWQVSTALDDPDFYLIVAIKQ